jgi:uncharacterized protein (DUF58 family)
MNIELDIKREEIIVLIILILFAESYLFRNLMPAVLGFLILMYITYLRKEFRPVVDVQWESSEKRMGGERVVEGTKVSFRLKVRNMCDKGLNVEVIHKLPIGFWAESIFFHLNGHEEKTFKYDVIPVRGRYEIEAPTLIVSDVHGLYYEEIKIDSKIELEVYPSLDGIRRDVEADVGASILHTKLGLQTSEIDSLRRYQQGDDLKYVEWKATTRLGDLVVKDFLREWEGDVYIVLDAGRSMRKGKISYATTLALQLAHLLRNNRLGFVVYDDIGVVRRIKPTKSDEQVENIRRVLGISSIQSELWGVKIPNIRVGEGRDFLRKIRCMLKGRQGFASGLIEAFSIIPPSYVILIADITSNLSELVKVLCEIKKTHHVIVLTPNPILFYDPDKLDTDSLLWLYRRYVERENMLNKLNRIVPTIDLGPSDIDIGELWEERI